jgi:hypothetical protein
MFGANGLREGGFGMVSDEAYKAAAARGERAKRLGAGVPRLKAVRLLAGEPENAAAFLAEVPGLNSADRYAVLGEVGASGHYVILNLSSGQILPGVFHLDRFEEIPDDDL